MTQTESTTASSDPVALNQLFAQVSGLLENGAESAEVRIRRVSALLREYPVMRDQPSDAQLFPDAHGIQRGALLAWQRRKVTDYIESHMEDPIGIEDLSAVARLSPSHFCRAFRVSFTDSPHSYVMRRRIARSQTLMLTTSAPLSNIAIECGFADQGHFSRVHRRLVGVTPGAWRRLRQDAEYQSV